MCNFGNDLAQKCACSSPGSCPAPTPSSATPRGATAEQAPSLRLHEKIRSAWGLDGPEGLVNKLMARYPGVGDPNNLGSLTTAMAEVYPQDRFGYAVFQQDTIYSDFSYRDFYPEIAAAPAAERTALLLAKWKPEVKAWTDAMKPYANIGYYVPHERNFIGSHCLTILGFDGTEIRSPQRFRSVEVFLDNLISRRGALIKAYEAEPAPQSTGGGALWDAITALFSGA